MLYTVLFLYFSFPLCSFALIYWYFFIIIVDKLTISFTKFKNASAFLLRDARHAKHDIFLLRISAILPEAISDGGLTPTTDTNLSPPEDVGVISHLILFFPRLYLIFVTYFFILV